MRTGFGNRRMSHGHGGRLDGLPMARGYGFRPLGTRRPRPGLSGLWADDAHLRSPLSPRPYLGRAGATDLQAQPLPRSHLSGTRQDQEPRTRDHHRPAPGGDRLGRLLLDRPSTLFPPHGHLLDPIRTPGRLRDPALRGCPRDLQAIRIFAIIVKSPSTRRSANYDEHGAYL